MRKIHVLALIMSSAACDGNVGWTCGSINIWVRQIVAALVASKPKQVYDVIRLSFDDCHDLSFGDDVVEFDQDSLDSSGRRRRDRDFHFHRFNESNLVAIADIASGCDWKCAHAPGDFGDDLDLWHFRSPGDRLTDWCPRERLFVVAADCLR
jgi:hypothetical protein